MSSQYSTIPQREAERTSSANTSTPTATGIYNHYTHPWQIIAINQRYSEAMGETYADPPEDSESEPTLHDYTFKKDSEIAHFIADQSIPRSYTNLFREEMRLKAMQRNLPVSGTKALLRTRLQTWDAAQPPTILLTYYRVSEFRFLDLPSEIRSKVYGELLQIVRPAFQYGFAVKRADVKILRTSRQIYNEAVSVLYSINQVHLSVCGDNHISYRSQLINVFLPFNTRRVQTPQVTNPWSRLPRFLNRCEDWVIELKFHRFPGHGHATQAELEILIVQMRSLALFFLSPTTCLRRLRVEFQVGAERQQELQLLFRHSTIPIATAAAMKTFETMALFAIGQLRGLASVEFDGIMFANPNFVEQVRMAMLGFYPVRREGTSEFMVHI